MCGVWGSCSRVRDTQRATWTLAVGTGRPLAPVLWEGCPSMASEWLQQVSGGTVAVET